MHYPGAAMAAPGDAVVLGLGGAAAALIVALGLLAFLLARRAAGLDEELARARAVADTGSDAAFHWTKKAARASASRFVRQRPTVPSVSMSSARAPRRGTAAIAARSTCSGFAM
jgi:hypothetical protein